MQSTVRKGLSIVFIFLQQCLKCRFLLHNNEKVNLCHLCCIFAFRGIMDIFSKAVIMDYFNQQEVMASHSQERTGQQHLFI